MDSSKAELVKMFDVKNCEQIKGGLALVNGMEGAMMMDVSDEEDGTTPMIMFRLKVHGVEEPLFLALKQRGFIEMHHAINHMKGEFEKEFGKMPEPVNPQIKTYTHHPDVH